MHNRRILRGFRTKTKGVGTCQRNLLTALLEAVCTASSQAACHARARETRLAQYCGESSRKERKITPDQMWSLPSHLLKKPRTAGFMTPEEREERAAIPDSCIERIRNCRIHD
eukprot:6186942-Pleurochrysis_carterae.AAC.1